jgi:hypothetical protein
MTPQIIEKCRSRIRIASKALGEIAGVKNFSEFSDGWYTFLTAWKNVYTLLEQAAKATPQATTWFELKREEKRNEPLLRYLYQARNDEEHGIGRSIEPAGSSLYLEHSSDPNAKGEATFLYKNDGDGFKYTLTSVTGDAYRKIRIHGPEIALQSVKTEKGIFIPPPFAFRGAMLQDRTPVAVAGLALDYIKSMVDEAEALHASVSP